MKQGAGGCAGWCIRRLITPSYWRTSESVSTRSGKFMRTYRDLSTNEIACREVYTVHTNGSVFVSGRMYTNATMICEINSSFSRSSLVYTLKAMQLSWWVLYTNLKFLASRVKHELYKNDIYILISPLSRDRRLAFWPACRLYSNYGRGIWRLLALRIVKQLRPRVRYGTGELTTWVPVLVSHGSQDTGGKS